MEGVGVEARDLHGAVVSVGLALGPAVQQVAVEAVSAFFLVVEGRGVVVGAVGVEADADVVEAYFYGVALLDEEFGLPGAEEFGRAVGGAAGGAREEGRR